MTKGISAHLGRLVDIAEGEPELREGIQQYMAALRQVPDQGAAGQ